MTYVKVSFIVNIGNLFTEIFQVIYFIQNYKNARIVKLILPSPFIQLFSGSVQTQAGDEAANSVSSSSDSDSDSDSNRANDGYTEGIPGPVTRLVVLANRGLANLVQDLILVRKTNDSTYSNKINK